MKLKKISAVIMCIVLTICFSVTAFAVIEEQGILYEPIDNSSVLEIKGIYANGILANEPDIVIPATIGGKKVVKIASSAFYSNSVIQTISLPDILTTLSEYALYGAVNLQNVELPVQLVKLGRNAFAYCTALTTAEFRTQKLSVIEKYTFYGCEHLGRVILPENLFMIEDYAFGNCPSLHEIYIPNTVSSISDSAFANAENLTIYGKGGSFAEQYALKNNIVFEDITTRPLDELDNWIYALSYAINDSSMNYYTSESVSQLCTVFSNTLDIRNDFFSTTAQLENALQTLKDTYYALQLKNLPLLTEAVTQGENILQHSYQYTQDTVQTLENTVNEARNVLNSSFPDNFAVENAINKVNNSIANMQQMLLGDMNTDNCISLSDAVMLQKYLLGFAFETDERQRYCADFNQDGKISLADVVGIQRYIIRS